MPVEPMMAEPGVSTVQSVTPGTGEPPASTARDRKRIVSPIAVAMVSAGRTSIRATVCATVTADRAVAVPAVATISAAPCASAVTRPVPVTLATSGAVDDHTIAPPLLVRAVSVAVSPRALNVRAVGVIDTVTGVGSGSAPQPRATNPNAPKPIQLIRRRRTPNAFRTGAPESPWPPSAAEAVPPPRNPARDQPRTGPPFPGVDPDPWPAP